MSSACKINVGWNRNEFFRITWKIRSLQSHQHHLTDFLSKIVGPV